MILPESLTSSPAEEVPPRSIPRLPVLDGWRGISILAVMSAHMLPLGPNRWQLNYAAGLLGMALFFTLSGFLITTTLYFHPSVRTFIIRRLFRILPLALLYLLIVLPLQHATRATWIAHLLFYENLPPFRLTEYTSHFWSLCVEMQFYAGIAILFLLFRHKGLVLLPVTCVLVTLWRIHAGATSSIVTAYRVDEILAGASLAFLFHGSLSKTLTRLLKPIPPLVPLVLLLLSTHVAFPWLNYLRPYFAAILVGTTIVAQRKTWSAVLTCRPLVYIAGISYALYIWNEMMHHGWFEEGSKALKYAKRPIGFGLNFLLAHLSTYYFEDYWIRLGKRLTQRKHSIPRAA